MRKWLLRALVISLLMHAALLVFFNVKKLENFGYVRAERLAPPIFKLRQVQIPKTLDEDTKLSHPTRNPSRWSQLRKRSRWWTTCWSHRWRRR